MKSVVALRKVVVLGKAMRAFTLLELVVVLLILGLLAATASPYYVNMQVDSRAQVINQIGGSMRAAVNQVYAKAVTNGLEKSANSSIVIAGSTVRLRFGYPHGSDLRNILLKLTPAANFTVSSAGSNMQVRHVNAQTPARCQVRYNRPNAINTLPQIVITNDQC